MIYFLGQNGQVWGYWPVSWQGNPDGKLGWGMKSLRTLSHMQLVMQPWRVLDSFA